MATTDEEQVPTDSDAADSTPRRWPNLLLSQLGNDRTLLFAGAGVALLISGLCAWLLSGKEGPTPREQLQRALSLLDDRETLGTREQARDIAKQLRDSDYRDPNFAGAPEFILGIAAFRDAEDVDELERHDHYRTAASFLKIAAEKTLDEERYGAEWAYSLGISLHELGGSEAAREPLEQAVKTYAPGEVEAAMHLQDIYLDLKQEEGLARALELNSQLLERDDLQPGQLDRVYIQRAQVYLAQNKNLEAEETLKNVSPEAAASHATSVIRGQSLMAQARFGEAIEILQRVAQDVGLENYYPRQASYLIGICHEKRGDFDEAQNVYGDTASKYAESHEGLAANLRRAELLRKDGSDEQALKAYTLALAAVRPEGFTNRWLTRDVFRSVVDNAWREWIESQKYEEAIELSKHMTPLFTDVEGYRRAADAHKLWAEHLEQELADATFTERINRATELRERWQLSGKAFADLAEVLRASPEYPDELWNSADHYRKGHDFENALIQLTRFINTGPTERLPLALIRRGEVLLDLHRLDGSNRDNSALDQFQRVIENHPTDIMVFQARYLLGKCYFEMDRPELAEKVWRDIITSDELTPAANEWKLALFSIGKLLYDIAIKKKYEAGRPVEGEASVDPEALLAEAYSNLDEAIFRMEEFLKRNPHRPEAVEARYLLAKSLQHRAALPRERLKSAETENARNELKEDMRRLLTQAAGEFYALQEDLLKKDEQDMLDTLGQDLLRYCHFEQAHTFYHLEEFENAIQAYSSAANRYTDDPQVLLAYLQMTNCNLRIGRLADARSMAVQARLILNQMPESAFQSKSSNLTREEWQRWLQWSDELNQTLHASNTPEP